MPESYGLSDNASPFQSSQGENNGMSQIKGQSSLAFSSHWQGVLERNGGTFSSVFITVVGWKADMVRIAWATTDASFPAV